jgi:hypothetical protein
MSFQADTAEDAEHEKTVESQLQQLEKVLTGILAGIALMNGLTPSQLIELAEGL